MAGFDTRIKAAFDRQNKEMREVGKAFNTMRLIAMALLVELSPDDHRVTLSAVKLNAMSDRMKYLSLNLENKALTDEVVVTLVDNEVEVTMSVNPEAGALEANTEPVQTPEAPIEITLPTYCRCTHTNGRHIGGAGGCKETDCSCTEFEEDRKPFGRLQ